MSTAYTTLGHTPHRSAFRGATWLAGLTATLIAGIRRLDRWQLARRSDTPTTADDVLNWASRIESTEPGFASDLRGAALRSMDR